MSAGSIAGFISLVGTIVLWIAFWRLRQALINHVRKLKKALLTLDEGLWERIELALEEEKG